MSRTIWKTLYRTHTHYEPGVGFPHHPTKHADAKVVIGQRSVNVNRLKGIRMAEIKKEKNNVLDI